MPHRLHLASWPRSILWKVVIKTCAFLLVLAVWLLYIYSDSYPPVDRRSSSLDVTTLTSARRDQVSDSETILRRPTVPVFEGFVSECDVESGSHGGFQKVNVSRRGDYIVLNHLIERRLRFGYMDSITLTTHGTYELLDNLVFLSQRWQGPISVTVYSPGTDFQISVEYVLWLRHCYRTVLDFVTFNFVLPEEPLRDQWKSVVTKSKIGATTTARSILSTLAQTNANWTVESVVVTERHPTTTTTRQPRSTSTTLWKFDYVEALRGVSRCQYASCNATYSLPLRSYRLQNGLPYPINVCRNVARLNANTNFILASDIELYPSSNVISRFLAYIRSSGSITVPSRNPSTPPPPPRSNHLGSTSLLSTLFSNLARAQIPPPASPPRIYVLPIFEVDKIVKETPATKAALVDLYRHRKAVYFHKHVCSFCNIIPKLNQWLLSPVAPQKLGTFFVIKRHRPFNRWEPIYIGTNSEPLYDERLSWEGQQDKMTQMYELCLLNYDLAILDNAFLVHRPGIKTKNETEYKVKSAFIAQNNKVYHEAIKELEKKYGANQWCK